MNFQILFALPKNLHANQFFNRLFVRNEFAYYTRSSLPYFEKKTITGQKSKSTFLQNRGAKLLSILCQTQFLPKIFEELCANEFSCFVHKVKDT